MKIKLSELSNDAKLIQVFGDGDSLNTHVITKSEILEDLKSPKNDYNQSEEFGCEVKVFLGESLYEALDLKEILKENILKNKSFVEGYNEKAFENLIENWDDKIDKFEAFINEVLTYYSKNHVSDMEVDIYQ